MRLMSASDRAGRILPGHDTTRGTRTSSSYIAGPLSREAMRAPVVAVVRGENRDRRDIARCEGIEDRPDLAIDGFDQAVIERAIAAPHLPVGAGEGLPLILLEIVTLRERLVLKVVDQVWREPHGCQRSPVRRRRCEDVVDVVGVYPGHDEEQGLARFVHGALLHEPDDAARECRVVNRGIVRLEPVIAGVPPRCHLPK